MWHEEPWTGLFLLRTGTGGRRMWSWTFGFHKLWGISWLAEDLWASQEELCSVELVIYVYGREFRSNLPTCWHLIGCSMTSQLPVLQHRNILLLCHTVLPFLQVKIWGALKIRYYFFFKYILQVCRSNCITCNFVRQGASADWGWHGIATSMWCCTCLMQLPSSPTVWYTNFFLVYHK
jgi:hypothetical protein